MRKGQGEGGVAKGWGRLEVLLAYPEPPFICGQKNFYTKCKRSKEAVLT